MFPITGKNSRRPETERSSPTDVQLGCEQAPKWGIERTEKSASAWLARLTVTNFFSSPSLLHLEGTLEPVHRLMLWRLGSLGEIDGSSLPVVKSKLEHFKDSIRLSEKLQKNRNNT